MNGINVTVQSLSVVALVAGAYGSMLFVDTDKTPANYSVGSQVFLLGNVLNIAVGMHIGDLSMVIAQAGLVYYTVPMFDNKRVSLLLFTIFAYSVLVLGTANHFSFTSTWLGACASAVAVYGAWAMERQKWNIMNWCWVIADLAFMYIAVVNQLLGLFILATLFVWHGFLRIMGYKRTGLFTFTKG